MEKKALLVRESKHQRWRWLFGCGWDEQQAKQPSAPSKLLAHIYTLWWLRSHAALQIVDICEWTSHLMLLTYRALCLLSSEGLWVCVWPPSAGGLWYSTSITTIAWRWCDGATECFVLMRCFGEMIHTCALFPTGLKGSMKPKFGTKLGLNTSCSCLHERCPSKYSTVY